MTNPILLLQQSPGAGSLIVNFLPIAVIVVIFYFFVIAPASKQRKKTEAMLAALKKGDRVLTTGGLYGQVHSVDNDVVWIRIAENVKVKVAKAAITSLVEAGSGE